MLTSSDVPVIGDEVLLAGVDAPLMQKNAQAGNQEYEVRQRYSCRRADDPSHAGSSILLSSSQQSCSHLRNRRGCVKVPAQADALEIEATAQRRLADEYDAAQERGEIASRSDNLRHGPEVPEENLGKPETAEIGLNKKQVHETRRIRDAEKAKPGIIRRTLDDKLERGEEATKAAVSTWGCY